MIRQFVGFRGSGTRPDGGSQSGAARALAQRFPHRGSNRFKRAALKDPHGSTREPRGAILLPTRPVQARHDTMGHPAAIALKQAQRFFFFFFFFWSAQSGRPDRSASWRRRIQVMSPAGWIRTHLGQLATEIIQRCRTLSDRGQGGHRAAARRRESRPRRLTTRTDRTRPGALRGQDIGLGGIHFYATTSTRGGGRCAMESDMREPSPGQLGSTTRRSSRQRPERFRVEALLGGNSKPKRMDPAGQFVQTPRTAA